jgi:hypothetical protein
LLPVAKGCVGNAAHSVRRSRKSSTRELSPDVLSVLIMTWREEFMLHALSRWSQCLTSEIRGSHCLEMRGSCELRRGYDRGTQSLRGQMRATSDDSSAASRFECHSEGSCCVFEVLVVTLRSPCLSSYLTQHAPTDHLKNMKHLRRLATLPSHYLVDRAIKRP